MSEEDSSEGSLLAAAVAGGSGEAVEPSVEERELIARMLATAVAQDAALPKTCASCDNATPKYRCPACDRRSCSLACVNKHKEQFECTGVRTKTSFVALSDFNDAVLNSDFHFLEDINRTADNVRRDPLAKPSWMVPQRSQLLLNATRYRKIRLRIMPLKMQRHVENTSYFDVKKRIIFWRIEWVFPKVDAKIVDERAAENIPLSELLASHLEPRQGNAADRQLVHPYAAAHATDASRLRVCMKVEGRPANDNRYLFFDSAFSLDRALPFMLIHEYPTLIVVLPDELARYPEIDPAEHNRESAERGGSNRSGNGDRQGKHAGKRNRDAGDAAADSDSTPSKMARIDASAVDSVGDAGADTTAEVGVGGQSIQHHDDDGGPPLEISRVPTRELDSMDAAV